MFCEPDKLGRVTRVPVSLGPILKSDPEYFDSNPNPDLMI